MVEGFLYVMRRIWYFSYKKHQFAVQTNIVKLSLGDLSDVGTPGPIPNPEVKHVSADGTWRATSRESRSLPRGFSLSFTAAQLGGFYFLIFSCGGFIFHKTALANIQILV